MNEREALRPGCFPDRRFEDGSTRRAELHWFEATGIGKKEFKIKYFLD